MNLPNMYSFTFYYIYIKTTNKILTSKKAITFTFYYIYIKTINLDLLKKPYIIFTFYYIYIKTGQHKPVELSSLDSINLSILIKLIYFYF